MRSMRLWFTLGIVAALVVGFAGGFAYVKHTQVAADAIVTQVTNKDQPGTSSAVDFGLFWQVWDRLHQKYVDSGTLDAQKLVYGAISGMVQAAGDPYTVFFPPADSKKFQEEVNGSFAGAGMEIGLRNDVITVIAPIKDSPAMRAGIKAGDVIVKIDGTSTEGMTVDDAVSRIRGKKGTTVHITILRQGEADLLEITLTRDTIRVPAVDWKLVDDHIAYLQLYTFNGNLDDQFAQAARDIIASKADRLIIDLRGNPGGLLDSAVNVAGWLLPSNSLVVQERYGNGLTDSMRTTGNASLAKLPIVMLIDEGSASAAEILAGALHDDRGVRLVGTTSFGKGSVQELEDFFNGSSLKVTVAKWLTPNGVNISKVGIVPTDELKLDPKDPNAKNWEIGTPGKDPQLDKAITIINNF